MTGAEEQSSGRFAYEGLERAIHEKARLGILSSLVAHPDGLVFSELKDQCCLTDGNLSRHIKVLQETGLIEVAKSFHENRPQTRCRLTVDGRKRFLEYVSVLEQVVADAAQAESAASGAKSNRAGWSPA